MLSYRHGFHAGNFADVHKHVVLVLLLRALMRKDGPMCYIETHAGAGLYDLQHEYSQKKREYEDGIGRLWSQADLPEPVGDYVQIVRAANRLGANDKGPLRYYPGSPWIAHHLLRAQDRMVLMELHGTEAPLLAKRFGRERRIIVERCDGYEGLRAHLPPKERRGLVLIDPAYERRDEFERAVAALKEAWARWSTGVFALWYPVLARKPVERFHQAIVASGMRKVLLCEFCVLPDDVPDRLNGSGLILVNPPWQFDAQIKQTMDWLFPVLAQGPAPAPRVEWLIPE